MMTVLVVIVATLGLLVITPLLYLVILNIGMMETVLAAFHAPRVFLTVLIVRCAIVSYLSSLICVWIGALLSQTTDIALGVGALVTWGVVIVCVKVFEGALSGEYLGPPLMVGYALTGVIAGVGGLLHSWSFLVVARPT